MKIKKNSSKQATVRLSIIIAIAQKNLLHKKLRTTLTATGIAIGIGAVYFLLSFGLGLQHLVTTEVIGNQSIKTIDVTTPNSQIIKIDDINTQRIEEIASVENVGKAYYFPGGIKLSNSESDAIVYGIDSHYESLTILNLVSGVFLGSSTEQKPIVLNKATLQAAGLTDDPDAIIGKTVEIIVPLAKYRPEAGTYTDTFTIVGIIDSGSGSEVFVPSRVFRERGIDAYTQLKVGAQDVTDVKIIRSQIESLGFETTSPIDTIEEINRVFRFFNLILIGFGGIGMIIAILGMFNTLTISLLERTKEIGLMIALGARSVDVKKMFIIEALMLSLLGSVIGMMGAYILGRGINVIMNIFASKRGVQGSFELFANPPYLVAGTLIFMVSVGLLVVFLPARRAQRINPIDALRRE